MFGHLSAEDFTNLLEGTVLPDRRQSHLRSCPRCLKKFESVKEVRNQISDMGTDADAFVPEPDWTEFRSSVRDTLLSRSVKRENAARIPWSMFTRRPALVWACSMLLVIGLTTTALWNRQPEEPASTSIASVEESLTEEDNINSIASLSQSDVFEDLIQLSSDEANSLQMILEDLTQKGVSRQ
jgi:hypothetical protein